ncbi:hypothetical protein ETH_00008350 [Eimeria tenella]|uniref:Uncharacterized protein n=1 Tax=Eimeria tenella TaxID=5802 RepID=U6KYX1_EIMTE|nr:hypothetical protein ETH_00008350 [Eimeria tenella]CDJ43367.1 hypothetical protein ETH_00008350 [Eimeria tenella]|eukprot:XP_013234117.1 hypothetical protein ETH_00008350 [Eimeria tenella]
MLQLQEFVLPLLMLQLMLHHQPFPFVSSALPAGAASAEAGEDEMKEPRAIAATHSSRPQQQHAAAVCSGKQQQQTASGSSKRQQAAARGGMQQQVAAASSRVKQQ